MADESYPLIRTLEELGMNAWPSLQTALYDGWVLRFADGYTRRANSVHPLYPSSIGVEEKLRVCERFYQAKGLDVIFKMTSSAQPGNLDDVLAAKGYAANARTSVQVLNLGNVNQAPTQKTTLTESLSDEWLDAFCRLSSTSDRRKPALKQMLGNPVLTRCFASIHYQGQVIACGIGVLQEQYVGLFDIITEAGVRRQGFGKQLVLNILAWAKCGGAQTAYLQVMLNNDPALRLYSSLGFTEVYQYWYRIKSVWRNS
jgi:GNAT superfamily N-acetyltransferase